MISLPGSLKERIGFRRHSDTDQAVFRLVVDFGLPIVYFVLLRDRVSCSERYIRSQRTRSLSSLRQNSWQFPILVQTPTPKRLFLESQGIETARYRSGPIQVDSLARTLYACELQSTLDRSQHLMPTFLPADTLFFATHP